MWKPIPLLSSYSTPRLRLPTTIGRDLYHIDTEMPRRGKTEEVDLSKDGMRFRDSDSLNDHLDRNIGA